MKKIHVLRHAKSSWKDPWMEDVDRPLKKRGRRDCQLMASALIQAGCSFENVFCSPALRARMTIDCIAIELGNGTIQYQIANALYCFHSTGIFQWCQTLNDNITDLMIVGHNSALTDFVNDVGLADLENLPTCGYAQLHLPLDSWGHLDYALGRCHCIITPKMLKEGLI